MTIGRPYFLTNKEWYVVDRVNGGWKLTDKATPKAIESFKKFQEWMKKAKEDGDLW